MKKSLLKKAAAIFVVAATLICSAQAAFAEGSNVIYDPAIVKVGGEVGLTGLTINTAVHDARTIQFTPAVTEYNYNVQSDIYGVKVTATAPEGTAITIDGKEVKSGESKIVTINGDYANYDIVLVTPIKITATKGDASKTYTINVVRDCDTDVYNLFQQLSYTDPETGVVLPYCLYLPTNYDPSKKYPIVFALHGSGQRTQSLDMVLKRYQMATVWAKDSEAGHNQCIVLAPQCKLTAEEAVLNNWTTLMSYREGIGANAFETTPYLESAYRLLLQVMDQYSVDKSRVYMTGLSAGGFGTFTLAQEYPQTFAAIAPDASGADPSKIEALRGIPMWIFQAEDDPTVKIVEYYNPTIEALNKAGIPYRTTLYKAGTVFGTSAHFSWVPMYADKTFRDWMFMQHR